jgi:hypothetical protein
MRTLIVKPTLNSPRNRHPRTAAPFSKTRTPGRYTQKDRWFLMTETDGGEDAAYRRLMERIARGERIRAHAF